MYNLKKLDTGRRDGSAVKSMAALLENPGLIPSANMEAHHF